MNATSRDMLLRLPPELMDELEAACDDEGLDRTELVIQGLVIRLRMKGKAKLPELLEAYGYQPRRRPGRPRKVEPALNGAGPAGSPAATGGLHHGT